MKDIVRAVDAHRQKILDAERYIWAHPETGYKETETSRYLAEQFEALGYELTYADGITGFYTVIDTGREGPEVLVLGELDSIICPAHKEANPETGAVHSCGHNAQCAALLGVAAALKDEAVLSKLSGKIRLCAVPAEELLEIGYRTRLRADGKIKVSLHACDTATDEALAKGVEWKARYVLSAPCCQHELQKTLADKGAFAGLMRQSILRERLADILTDSFRAMIMRILGFKTQVLEFVSSEATQRNIMLKCEYGVKPGQSGPVSEYLNLRDYWKVVPWLETRLAERLKRHFERYE